MPISHDPDFVNEEVRQAEREGVVYQEHCIDRVLENLRNYFENDPPSKRMSHAAAPSAPLGAGSNYWPAPNPFDGRIDNSYDDNRLEVI